MNNKMIGMVTGAEDLKPSVGTTTEQANMPKRTVKVVKASYILPLLSKLQQSENARGFN